MTALLDVPSKVTAQDVKDALRGRHPATAGAWVCVEEAFSGFASTCGGIDLLAIGAWRSAKAPGLPGAGRGDATNATVGYEVKVSRSDMRRELYGYQPGEGTKRNTRAVPKWPGKQQWALGHVHFFLFATPAGLLHQDEIERRVPWGDDAPRKGALYLPEGVGLVEIDGRGCHVRAAAERRDPQPWSRHQTHELMRRIEYTSYARAQAAA